MTQVPEELQERIAAYIDGQLGPAEAARLEVYLANTDPQLADQVISMIADRHSVHGLPRPMAPRDLSARVMEQIERASLLHDVEHIAAPRSWWQSRAMIAASIALVLGGFTYFIVSSVLGTSNAEWRRNRDHPIVASVKEPATNTKLLEGQLANARALAPRRDVPDKAFDAAGKAGNAEDHAAMRPEGSFMAKGSIGPQIALTDAEREAARLKVDALLPETLKPLPATANANSAAATPPSSLMAVDTHGAETQMASAGPAGPETIFENQPLSVRGGRGGAFGGGGGGGRGAGSRGRGIAGRDSGSPATPSALQSAEEPAAVLASVTRNAGDQPVLLTFIARDAQDFGKLTSALDGFGATNRRNIQNANTVRGNYYDMQNQYSANTLDNQANTRNGAAITGVNQTNGTQQNIYNNSIVGSNEGGRSAKNNGQNNYDQVRQDDGIGNNGRHVEIMPQTGSQPMTQPAGVAVSEGSAGPYRMTLKPQQLTELAKEFRLGVVARGADAYVFKAIGDHAPVTADARGRRSVYQSAGYAEQQTGETKQLPQSATEGAPANELNLATKALTDKNVTASPEAVVAGKNADTMWVECIITMESATEPAAPPGNLPANGR